MVFCNKNLKEAILDYNNVTILILIDGFLQFIDSLMTYLGQCCHNPYFNRWFSAIKIRNRLQNNIFKVTILILIDGFLQYYLINIIKY